MVYINGDHNIAKLPVTVQWDGGWGKGLYQARLSLNFVRFDASDKNAMASFHEHLVINRWLLSLVNQNLQVFKARLGDDEFEGLTKNGQTKLYSLTTAFSHRFNAKLICASL